MSAHFPMEFFYQNSYVSLCIKKIKKFKKKHPLQWLGNPSKIDLFPVYHISAESAKVPICNQLLHSEYKPTCKCSFHSFYRQ